MHNIVYLSLVTRIAVNDNTDLIKRILDVVLYCIRQVSLDQHDNLF